MLISALLYHNFDYVSDREATCALLSLIKELFKLHRLIIKLNIEKQGFHGGKLNN